MEKRCTKCGDVKPLGEFHKAKNTKDGYYCQCKSCALISKRYDYLKHKDKRIQDTSKAYYKKYRFERMSKCEFPKKTNCYECGREFDAYHGCHIRCEICSKENARKHKNNAGRKYYRNNKESIKDKYGYGKNEKAKERYKLSETVRKDVKKRALKCCRAGRSELRDWYIAVILEEKGVLKEQITPELIAVQRVMIKIKRAVKEKEMKNEA